MPRLLEKTKKIRAKRFLTALEKTGSPREAAMEVLNIGSKGSKDLYNSASAAGSQMLERIRPTMLEALEKKGITPERLAEKIENLLESQDPLYIDKAIDKSLKIGVGGGYAPEKSVSANLNYNVKDDFEDETPLMGEK